MKVASARISSPRKYHKKEKWSNLLKGQSFYIHLPYSQKTQKLEKRLNNFGAVVDKFFHRGINFVISSEQQRLENKEYNTRARPKPHIETRYVCEDPTLILFKDFNCYQIRLIKTDERIIVMKELQAATRMSSVLKKVNLKYSCQYHEVIKAAENWGIKVKSLLAVNQWLSDVEKRMKASQTLRETPRVRRLKGTFIKVEEFHGKYRPLVKELDEWPKLHIDSRACPFDQTNQKPSKIKRNEKNLKRKLKQSGRLSIFYRWGYCEPCDVTYEDLNEHLNGSQHKIYARNHANFRSLDKLIGRGPSVEDLRQATKRKRAPATNYKL